MRRVGSRQARQRSYGEERPLMQGGNKQAWSQNRRGEFVIIEGMPATD